ncbi:hypothetical protein ACROYT_G027778 [Oculina patagonica]
MKVALLYPWLLTVALIFIPQLTAQCLAPLGMESRRIKDDQITASSVIHAAHQARLNFKGGHGGWTAETKDGNQWIQVDLGNNTKITGLATQGEYKYDQWVTKYKIQYSDDGMNFRYYKVPGRNSSKLSKVFNGNKNKNSIVKQTFNPPIVARYIRLRPTAWKGRISLRMEIYGCFLVPAKITNVSHIQTVREGSSSKLFCEASGNPTPNITWTKVLEDGSNSKVLHQGSVLNFPNVRRTASGVYRCEAHNGIGNPVSHKFILNVIYPAKIVKLASKLKVSAVQQSVSLHCQAEGNPKPTYTWTPCDPRKRLCHESMLNISEVVDDDIFSCKVTNVLGSDTRYTRLVIADKVINVTLVITSEDCTGGKYNQTLLWKTLNETMNQVFAGESGYSSARLTDIRCGSIIVDLAIKFSSTVRESKVLSILRDAAKNGMLGGFNVSASSIIGTRLEKATTEATATPTSSTEIAVCGGRTYIYIILGVVIGVLVVIIIGLVIYIVWRQRKGITEGKRTCQASHDEERANLDYEIEMAVLLPDPNPTAEQTSEALPQSKSDLNEETRPEEVKEPPRKKSSALYAPLLPFTRSWEVSREHVTIEKIIGKGAFGQVAKGTASGLRGRSQKTLVAVKMLKDDAPESDKNDLLSELEVMKKLKPHRHVIKLLGCVTESEPLLVLIEYVPFGDLLGYLRKSRGLNDMYYNDPDIKPKTNLTSHQLMKFAWQVADGMSYLSSKQIIHRDLAARNVLIGERETCKVTDFGMARDGSTYQRKSKGRLPIKWTAVEALLYRKYSTRSDVWSFGVLLYEIFTIGASPYPRMNGQQVVDLLKQEYRMPKPQHVDDKLYGIMMKCWQKDPYARPTFVDLRNELKEMENQHKRLINMEMYDEQLYANVEDLGGSTDCINVLGEAPQGIPQGTPQGPCPYLELV